MRDQQLLDQATYDQDRADRWWWQLQRETGLSRRALGRLFAAGAGAAALGARTVRPAAADHVRVVKPTPIEQFYIHGSNRESRFEVFKDQGYLTPNSLFFVRNHSTTPHIDPSTWRLKIFGTGVSREVEITYDELLRMPSRTETKFVECAGNFRSQFEVAYGTRASGTQWRSGAIGVAEWTGVPLNAVLDRAGLKPTAVDGMPEGLDSQRVRRPLPIQKLLENDTLLVYGMNGQTLPEDHGFPVRLLTPGWVGVCNVKWVGRIEVSDQALFSPWNTTSYVMFGDAYPDKPVVTNHFVKSAFELPWGGTIAAGPRVLTGRSWSGLAAIAKVEVSVDGGPWQAATLGSRNLPKAWVQWELPWNAEAGTHALRARATDTSGNVQPDSVPFNDQGYLYWAVTNHPITVA